MRGELRLGAMTLCTIMNKFVFIILLHSLCAIGQQDTIKVLHNGYSIQTDTRTIIDHFQIKEDSINYYADGISEIIESSPSYSSDFVIEFAAIVIDLICILEILSLDQSSIVIKRVSDNQIVNYKVKYEKRNVNTYGLGGSSETWIKIIDKKKRVVIAYEIIFRNLAC